ncbi:MAG: 2-hydroxyacid dehydrogenase [Candidatus Brocadiia bacterium]
MQESASQAENGPVTGKEFQNYQERIVSWNVYVTREIPEAGLERLRSHCDSVVVHPEDTAPTREEILEVVRGCDGLLCLLSDTIDAALMDAAGDSLKGIANYAVGYDNIDVAAATERGLPVSNTPGVLTDTTADLAWALIFAAARRIPDADRYMRTGDWSGWGPRQMLGVDISGKTLGIVGAGRIGSAVAMKSTGFDMQVLYVDHSDHPELEEGCGGHRVLLPELLEESDFVSLHVPLTEETSHMIGEDQIEKMKSTAVLVNTSRGPVVDEAALARGLQEGRIRAAGLDVYEEEPKVNQLLMELDNVVLTPHIGSASEETRDKMARMAAQNLIAMLEGQQPENCVNPEVYD